MASENENNIHPDICKSKYPLLAKIDTPADLRRLPVTDLPAVCAQIRAFLIDALSVNPGHFASSMGAVDFTVALHYVFNTPYDRIVWDVGHQAYPHKLLTGRRDRFATNRTMGGLSGFPSPDESPYDTFTAGHASNSISAALGMAVATRLQGDAPLRHVAAVIGDASISGGLAFEGLNNAANTPNNLLIVLNDNDMSIDRNVGALHGYMAHLNTSKRYNDVRYKIYRQMRRMGLIHENGRGLILRFNNAIKALLVGEQNIFEGLNIRYFGPFDGHDTVGLVRVLNQIKDLEGPKILHLRTRKGKGFAPAEKDPANWHAPGKFDAVTGDRKTGPAKCLKYQDVFGDTLLQMACADKRIVAVTAAMPSGTSIATMQAALPDRVFDVGISEGHAVTFAGGLAKEGLRPVVGIYSSFLQRAYDQIIHDVAVARLPVVFAIDRAGLVGEDGVTHHGANDIAYMRTVPGMTVAAPRDGNMLRRLMATALAWDKGPFAIRWPRGNAPQTDMDTPAMPLEVGRAQTLADPAGARAVVLSAGTMAANVTDALGLLQKKNIAAQHHDMVFVKPLDTDLLHRVAKSGLPVMTVEDGTPNGGLGSAVAQFFADNGYDVPLTVAALPDSFVKQGTVAQLQRQCGLDAGSLAARLENFINGQNAPAKPQQP